MSIGSQPSTPAMDAFVPRHAPIEGQPAWDMALLYPPQGQWTEEQYLNLTDHTKWLVEFTDGKIEVLPMPTIEHQLISQFLLVAMRAFIIPRKLGFVLYSPVRVYIRAEMYREPDLVFNFTARHSQSDKRYYQGADLVLEIVSDDPASNKRDWEQKRLDYADGGIPEYWIVDPQQRIITVLALQGTAYETHGTFAEGTQATSKLLDGFFVNVTDVFAAGKE